jgi:hypothetical protein
MSRAFQLEGTLKQNSLYCPWLACQAPWGNGPHPFGGPEARSHTTCSLADQEAADISLGPTLISVSTSLGKGKWLWHSHERLAGPEPSQVGQALRVNHMYQEIQGDEKVRTIWALTR